MLLNLKIFTERLKELQGNMSVAALAKTLGVTQPAMNYYIKGERKPSVELMIKLCYNFKVSFEWLVGLSDVRTPVKEAAPTVATPPAVPATTAGRRGSKKAAPPVSDMDAHAKRQIRQLVHGGGQLSMSDLYKLNNLPTTALLAQIQELSDRVRALESAASKPAFACS